MMTQAEIDGEYNDQVRHQRAKGNEMRDCGLNRQSQHREHREQQD